MIYDKLKNLSDYPQISKHLSAIISFLKDLQFDENQTIIINDKLKALLTIYQSGSKDIIESHDKYLDLVILLKGQEKINTGHKGKIKTAYDSQKDITIYDSLDIEKTIHLRPQHFLIFFPEDIHQPYLIDEYSCLCKKVTFKILI